eukprot:scaffold252757_cov18-Tisochrysis_lutea.AAC.3
MLAAGNPGSTGSISIVRARRLPSGHFLISFSFVTQEIDRSAQRGKNDMPTYKPKLVQCSVLARTREQGEKGVLLLEAVAIAADVKEKY